MGHHSEGRAAGGAEDNKHHDGGGKKRPGSGREWDFGLQWVVIDVRESPQCRDVTMLPWLSIDATSMQCTAFSFVFVVARPIYLTVCLVGILIAVMNGHIFVLDLWVPEAQWR